jgi:hypothetical protein
MHTKSFVVRKAGRHRNMDRVRGKGVSMKLSDCEQRIPSASITKAN